MMGAAMNITFSSPELIGRSAFCGKMEIRMDQNNHSMDAIPMCVEH